MSQMQQEITMRHLSVKVNDVTPNAAFNFLYEQDGEVFEFSSLEGVPTKFDAGLSTDTGCINI